MLDEELIGGIDEESKAHPHRKGDAAGGADLNVTLALGRRQDRLRFDDLGAQVVTGFPAKPLPGLGDGKAVVVHRHNGKDGDLSHTWCRQGGGIPVHQTQRSRYGGARRGGDRGKLGPRG